MTDDSREPHDDTSSDGTPSDDSPAGTPPRPRSAASRARRIGGAGAGPRPTPASEPTPAPVDRPTERSVEKPVAEPVAEPVAKPVDTATDEPAEEPTSDRRGVSVSLPGWSVWVPAVAFAAAAVVFLTLFVVARVGGGDEPGRSQETRERVLAAAKTCLATLNTYRYDKLPAAEAAGVKCTTGQLTTDYKRTVTNIIMKNAPSLQAIQQAKITTAGIESVTGNGKQWTVLAYGTLSIVTREQKQGRNDPFAVVARLQQVGDSWVLSKIDTVSSSAS